MKKMKNILFIAVSAFMLSSCVAVMPAWVTDNCGDKVGQAEARYLFGSYPLGGGDYSIKAACEDGDINKVSTVDIRVQGGLFITTITTIVTGE